MGIVKIAGQLKIKWTIPGGSVASEITCPMCNADVPLGGDERRGDEIFCSVCSAPLKLKGDYGDEDLEAEEDF
jgi:CRISPR/Cas system-associated protein Cas10 (large subunit of type III CRISPR-Cas system)